MIPLASFLKLEGRNRKGQTLGTVVRLGRLMRLRLRGRILHLFWFLTSPGVDLWLCGCLRAAVRGRKHQVPPREVMEGAWGDTLFTSTMRDILPRVGGTHKYMKAERF